MSILHRDSSERDSTEYRSPEIELALLPEKVRRIINMRIVSDKHVMAGRGCGCDAVTVAKYCHQYESLIGRLIEHRAGQFALFGGNNPFPKISRAGYIYLFKAPSGIYKIGKSKFPDKRLYSLNLILPFDLTLEHQIQTADCHVLEVSIHAEYADRRIKREWFALTDSDVAEFKAR